MVFSPSKKSLLERLGETFPEASKSSLRSWVKLGRVTVDQIIVKNGSAPIDAEQKVELKAKPKFFYGGIKILFQDRDLVVIDKPEGLLSVNTDGGEAPSAHQYLKRDNEYVYPVHRLDRETSGVMTFAYSEAAKEGLKKQFEVHSIRREYRALVEGIVKTPAGFWESYLYEDDHFYVSSIQDRSQGAYARTHYEVLERSRRTTYLKLVLDTGKKHQIRVHCSEAGHPVVGDLKYGGRKAKRMCLHAHILEFIHPITGKTMLFTSDLPELFNAFTQRKEKASLFQDKGER